MQAWESHMIYYYKNYGIIELKEIGAVSEIT